MAGYWYVAVGLIFLVQLVLQTDGVAPDDAHPICRTNFLYRMAHDWIPYANDTSSGTWKVLIDQYDYQNLIGHAGVWITLDDDRQTLDGKTFVQGSGGTCTYQIQVRNTYVNSNSNNWIFTQAIDYLDAVELIVNATVRFSGCIQRRAANPPCLNDYVILHRYDTNTLSETQRMKPTNYQPYFNNSESSRLRQDQVNTETDTNIINRFRRPANINHTYLGLQDIGSTGSVVRIFMYYEVCPRRVEGIVTYPEVPYPGQLPGASSRTTRLAQCAERSHNTTSLETYAYQDGRCEQSVTCVCDAGYEKNGRQCVACTPGKYRSTLNSSCVNCPANSNSMLPASESCICNEDHYRVSSSEGIGVACTAPPPPISSCAVTRQFDTAITIQWRTPAHCGGRSDCYYLIKINDGPPKRHSPEFRSSTQETFTVENLQQDTTYSISVSIHNGVSDQDSANARLRECLITAKTLQGSVFMLRGVTYLNNTAVLLEDIDSTNPLVCTTASTSCCVGNSVQGIGFYYPDGSRVLTQNQASSSSQRLYMTQNQGSICLRQQAGTDSPPLGRYRCQIPDGRGTPQSLYIRIGTAISPPGPNDTTDKPTKISVGAVLYDAIILNIPNTLVNMIDKVEARIEERQAPSDPGVQTKPPIIFTAPIMGRSRDQQLIITIPQENIATIVKGSAYFVKIKPIFVNGSQGDYGLPYFFNGIIIRESQASSSSRETCISFIVFIGVIVGILLFAAVVITLILISLCVTCKLNNVKSHLKGAQNPLTLTTYNYDSKTKI